MPELRPFGSQETASCRRVVEQVVYLDRGAARVGRGTRTTDLPAVGLDLRRNVIRRGKRRQYQARHRGNTRQSLTPKTQRYDGLQVFQARDLAGRVPGKRQRQFVPVDAATVVAHPDQLRPARSYVDMDIVGAGVETVFDELLDDGGRPLDDLAGSDLVDEVAGQLLD